MLKRIVGTVLGFIFAFSAVSCKAKEKENKEGAFNVWTTGSTEKILQQQDYNERYDNVSLEVSAFKNEREAGQIIISANKDKKLDVSEYHLTLSDLQDGNGNVLPKAVWAVYNQKYTFVPKICENILSGLDIGWYPDALLPMETAVDYGENSIRWDAVETANKAKGYNLSEATNINQGIWVELNVPKDAIAGIYTGTFTLTIDGENHNIPVQVEIYNYALGDYTHLKSSFGLMPRHIGLAELDTSKEMYKTYENVLLDHRLNPQGLPTGGDLMEVDITKSDELMEAFLQEAVEAAMDGRWVSFNIPYSRTTKNLYYLVDTVMQDGKPLEVLSQIYTVDSDTDEVDFTVVRNDDGTYAEISQAQRNSAVRSTESVVDFDKYQQILLALADRGLKESIKNISNDNVSEPVDIMKLVGTYFIMFDEFNQSGRETFVVAGYCQEKAYWVNQETADIIQDTLTLSAQDSMAFANKYGIAFDDYKAKIVKECREIRNKIVGNYDEEMLASHGVYVPQIRHLNDPDQRAVYENYELNSYGESAESELWTYICNHPNTPYTTLQTDDFLISSRMYGWLLYEANIVGHLEWSSVYNWKGVLYDGWKTIPDILMDNYYDALRWPTANGEGSLLYPGREYGIYGPVASIRLKSLADGIEDYDLLYELEEKYKERGVSGKSFDNIYKLFYGELRNGMKINYTDTILSDFQSAREMLAQLLVNAYEYGVILEDYDAPKDKGIVTVSAPNGIEIVCNDNQAVSLSEETDANGNTYVRYNFEIELNSAKNMLTLQARNSQETLFTVEMGVGGKTVSLDGSQLKEYIFTSMSDELDDSILSIDNSLTIEREADGETLQETVSTITYKGLGADSELDYQRMLVKVSEWGFNADTESIQLYVYYDGEESVNLEVLYNTESKRIFDISKSCTLKQGWNEITIYGGSLNFAKETDTIKYLAFSVKTKAECTISLGSVIVRG